VAQVTPAFFRYPYPEPAGGVPNTLPRHRAFSVSNALNLIKASYCTSNVTCVNQGLFPLRRESELLVAQTAVHTAAQFGHPEPSIHIRLPSFD
jgi:hypothetical protein